MNAIIRTATLTALVGLLLACSGDSAPSFVPQAHAAPSEAPSVRGVAAPGVSSRGAVIQPRSMPLANAPTIDLLHNRYLWHLAPPGHSKGLLIPFASEGLRKYTSRDKAVWGDVVELEEHSGRALGKPGATLTLPWHDASKATLRLRLHGLVKGQRLSINVNGKAVASLAIEPAWRTVEVILKDGQLRPGENEIFLRMGRSGKPGRSFGLFHSLDLTPGSAPPPPEAWPPLSPAGRATLGDEARPALRGFMGQLIYMEVPEHAWLEVHTGLPAGEARFLVRARPFDGPERTLLDHPARAGLWERHTIPLSEYGGRVVALALEVQGSPDGLWGSPRIALEASKPFPRPKPYANAILLVVDALRADRLALYNETRVQTPRITEDGAARGVVFLNHQTVSPSSPPSHATIQTGMLPRVHGVNGDKGKLRPATPLISAQLDEAGILAAHYGNNIFGMGRLRKAGRWHAFHHPCHEGKGLDCSAMMTEMLAYCKAQATQKKRFFISALPIETHTPYRYHKGISERYHKGTWGPPVGKSIDATNFGKVSPRNKARWSQFTALYDGEVEHFDGCYGQLLDGLKGLGLLESTMIVLTSDHGEGMREHGLLGHAFGHWGELSNVPFVLLGHGLVPRGRAVDTVSSALDLVPTILDAMGVPASERIQGQSLLPVALRPGAWVPRVVPLEYGTSYALRSARWKYIVDYQHKEHLFHLTEDPTEQTNVSETNPFILRYMRDIAGFHLAHRGDWRMETWGTVNNHGAGFLQGVGEEI